MQSSDGRNGLTDLAFSFSGLALVMGKKPVNHEDSKNFYRNLKALESFDHGLDPKNLSALPRDWFFFVTDIVNSTELVQNKGYRKINQTAAACLTAVLNATEYPVIPYVFGGDGIQLATPAPYYWQTHEALLAVAKRVKRFYGIELQVAGFRVDILANHGHEILVGKLALSEKVDQAVFWGNGLDAVDSWIRENDWSLDQPDNISEPDLSGLECRWKEIPGKSEEVVTLMAQVLPGHPEPASIYRNLSQWLEDAFGPEASRHPIRQEDLQLHLESNEQSLEVDFRNFEKPAWIRSVMKHWNALENKVGDHMMKAKKRFLGVDWGDYHQEVLRFGDHQKFSGLLAITSSTTAEKRKALLDRLEAAHQRAELAYGVHLSSHVVITCMIMDRANHHRHFIDGTNAAYTHAAKDFKSRLFRRNS